LTLFNIELNFVPYQTNQAIYTENRPLRKI